MRASLLALAVAAAAPLLPGVAAPAFAADYSMATQATYVVDPDAELIDVSVAVSFTNTTPDPPGQYSLFEEVQLAVHDGASEVTARDADGALTVSVARQKEVNVATVRLRRGLRHQQSASFTLAYRLADGAEPALRVRGSLVVFHAWGFGTSSSVRIELPAGYEVRSDGDPLQATAEATAIVLTSGAIGDPAHWVAVVTAARPTSYTTLRQSVPLAGGTVDLQVRAWVDDPEWGERIAALLSEALPLLEAATGFPYAGVGPLLVVEAATAPTSDLGEGRVAGQQIDVGYDATDFTVLHQAAHVWIGPSLFADRWLREGLASYLAGVAAVQLGVDLPFDPAARRADLAADGFPLAAWAGGGTNRAREAFGYAASWALIEAVAERIGPEQLQAALRRVAGGHGAYEIAPAVVPPGVAPDAPAVDSRQFLDLLELVGGVEISDLYAPEVFGAEQAELLAARSEARRAYADLVQAAGEWGAPVPVRQAMAAWQFAEAAEEIEAARGWLADRDMLLEAIAEAGLSMPVRLRQRYEESGGGADAWTELQAQRAVVEDYRRVTSLVGAKRSPLAQFGLLGETEPEGLLAVAAGQFADGDLSGAHDTIRQAGQIIEAAQGAGIARLISFLALSGALVGGAILVVRKRRGYTARP
jgi:hypothetical protein